MAPVMRAGEVIVGELVRLGLMLVPTVGASIAFARPKSSSFTAPSVRTLMFAGFRSR